MTIVACATGTDVAQLLHRPYWLTLYTFYHVQERELAHALERRRERIDGGFMTAFATHKPELLQDELRTVRDAIEQHGRPQAPVSDLDTIRARGLAMAARIEANGAFPPLVSDEPT